MNHRKATIRTVICAFLIITAISRPVLLAETKPIPQRSDIDDKYKWDLDIIYADLEKWEQDFTFIKNNYQRLLEYKGRLSESGDVLLECLKLNQEINMLADRLSTYAGLKLSEDTRVNSQQELSGRIGSLRSKINHASSFIESELLEIDSERLKSLVAENKELEVYSFYIDDLIRRKKHILSTKEEAILALAGSVAGSPGQIYSMLTNADMSFGTIDDEQGMPVELTKERYNKFRKSTDRRMRRDAHNAYYGTYEKYANTIAASLGGALKRDYFYMKARGYESCLEMSLARNNIPTSVYYNLIKTVNDNLDVLHKWAALKKKTLGYDTLYPYDLYVPLTAEKGDEYSYEQAKKIVIEGLAPMGEPYITDFKKGLNSGWVDVFETEGKSSGAFSGGSYTTPPYILLNFNGEIEWVFTLAHEMGHSMHSFYVRKNEPYIYSGYPIFIAEVASTCAETVLLKEILRNTTDKKERMFLINFYIQEIRTTFFRQVMFAEFELAIHNHIENGGAFSAEYFRQTFLDIYKKYWGETLEVDDLSGMLGMAIPHFYWQYYVYQYATCYSAAQLMSQKIIDGEDGYLDTYMKFLSTGSSKYPVDVLKEAGVDMTGPEPILYTIRLFGDLVDELETLLEEN